MDLREKPGDGIVLVVKGGHGAFLVVEGYDDNIRQYYLYLSKFCLKIIKNIYK